MGGFTMSKVSFVIHWNFSPKSSSNKSFFACFVFIDKNSSYVILVKFANIFCFYGDRRYICTYILVHIYRGTYKFVQSSVLVCCKSI